MNNSNNQIDDLHNRLKKIGTKENQPKEIQETKDLETKDEINLETKDIVPASSTDIYSILNKLNISIDCLTTKLDSLDTRSNIEKNIDIKRKKDEEVLGKESVSRGEVKVNKYTNYYDRHFIIGSTGVRDGFSATNPNDFDSRIYQVARVYEELDQRYGEIVHVLNRGTDTLFAIISHGGRTNFSKEEPIFPGDVKPYYHVYELRFRSATSGVFYQVTEYPIELNCCPTASIITTPVSIAQINPISKITPIQNAAQPSANSNILTSSVILTKTSNIIPTNTPSIIRVEVAMSNAGNFSVVIINGGNSQILALNNAPLVGGLLYTFDVLVDTGDTINYQYSSTGGTIQVMRVVEIDANIT